MTLQCERCLWVYEEGGYHDCNDEAIGSMLEYWLTRDTGALCRFCDRPVPVDQTGRSFFCSDACRYSFQEVADARLEIGRRDLSGRGFD